MIMRQPNGYGSVTKLTGSRRKPWMVRVTCNKEYDPEKKTYKYKRMVLGYYKTKAEALSALGVYNANPYNLDHDSLTFREIWEQIRDQVKASENRKKVYETDFNKYLTSIADMPIKTTKTAQLQKVFDDCEHGYSTKSNIRVVLRHIYNYALENDIVNKDYLQFVKFEQEATMLEREVYTTEEIENICKHQGEIFYDVTIILLHTGMRITELLDLKKDNVNLLDKTISITKAKNKYSIREIPVHDAVFHILKRYVEESTDDIFSISTKKYYYFVKTVLEHRPYDCRHTFATRANELNLNKIIIQTIMGHKLDSILEEYYIHLKMDDLREAMNKVEYGSVTSVLHI